MKALVAFWFCMASTLAETPAPDDRAAERDRMVAEQIAARGVRDPRVLAAMRAVPRHLYVPAALQADAYADSPLSIGSGQTISQPYIVAFMTERARIKPGDRVLEVGTGSGYQAAVLAQLTSDVYTIEIVRALYEKTRPLLEKIGLGADRVRLGDGYAGLPEHGPFDAIIVTAAPEQVPPPLLAQLKPGGRLVIPVGPSAGTQELLVIEKDAEGKTRERREIPVRFVPLTR